MDFFSVHGRRYAQFEDLRRQAGLTHAFSTKPFDVSLSAGERTAECSARRSQMAIDLGFDPGKVCCCGQVHEPRVAVVTEDWSGWLRDFDAVVTDVAGVALMTFSADCALVLAYDPVRQAVGIAHASWRCTVAAISRRLVETMRAEFGCDPARLHAGVGPSAGPTQYEVKDDVYEAAAQLPDRERLFHTRNDHIYFDLWEANRAQLERAGVPHASIEVAGICTMARNDLFYSYRREGPACGHFGLLAGLRSGSR
jgi:YfiH family protein